MTTRRLSPLVAGALLGSIIIATASAQERNPKSNEKFKGESIAILAAKPDYPLEARAKHWSGSGTVLLNVDVKSGRVTSARMLKSTGHKTLDDAALKAFRQWRFKAGVSPQVKCPITFTETGASY